MTREEVRTEVLRILRLCVLSGSTREIVMHEPLGNQGLGLDSLALVEFVSAVEKSFRVEIPDSIWTDRGALSPDDFVDLILGMQPLAVVPPSTASVRIWHDDPANRSYFQKAASEVRHRGILHGGWWLGKLAGSYLVERLYAREAHYILMKDLTSGTRVDGQSAVLKFRELRVQDEHLLGDLWPPHRRGRMKRLFRKRLQADFICLGAWSEEELVGIDFLSGSGDTDPDTGLTIKTEPGTCYALDLYEKYRGRGIGFALLGYSLYEAGQRGFRRQVTFVRKNNERMLAASMQLHGFKKIGEVETKRVFRKAFSEWKIGTRMGSKGIIQLAVLLFANLMLTVTQ